jgi:hypothetical protein
VPRAKSRIRCRPVVVLVDVEGEAAAVGGGHTSAYWRSWSKAGFSPALFVDPHQPHGGLAGRRRERQWWRRSTRARGRRCRGPRRAGSDRRPGRRAEVSNRCATTSVADESRRLGARDDP